MYKGGEAMITIFESIYMQMDGKWGV